MRNTRIPAILGSAVLALSLVACGDDDDSIDVDDTPTTEETPTTEPAEAPVEEDEDDGEADGDEGGAIDAEVTAPGTELAIGESATVPYSRSSDIGLVKITVTEIVPGDKAAFEAAFGEKAEGIDPYYIRYTVELVSIDPDQRPGTPALRATAPDGGRTGTVIAGSVDDCESERFGSDAEVGDTIETCRLQGSVTGSTTVGGAEYDEHTDYTDEPVLWLA